MIVGFTITDFKGHEKEAVRFIQKICILEDAAIAESIVKVGPGVNVFSKSITLSDLEECPFECTPIRVVDGKYLLVSAVNFNIELPYNGGLLRLAPTEYIYVEKWEVEQFSANVQQGLVRVIPDVTKNDWILHEGLWDDEGVWVDSDFWRD